MRILRVFPRRTSATPTDELSFVGDPPLFRPSAEEVDRVHVSCTFTWDIAEARRLAEAWDQFYKGGVRLGGPAISTVLLPEFVPGRYLREGITITSRGCPNRCPWCLVPEREGNLRELQEIAPGNEIGDNNLLACSRGHFRKVCRMLDRQPRAAIFSGGLDPRRLTPWHVERLQGIRIRSAFLAFDSEITRECAMRAVLRLRASGLSRRKVRCYVLIGYGDDTPEAAEGRLEDAWEWGALPFAMLWRGDAGRRRVPEQWYSIVHKWCRPAAMFAAAKKEAGP